MLLPPGFGEFALKGVFEDALAVRFELRLHLPKLRHAVVRLAKQLFDFGNNAVLSGQGLEYSK